MLIRKILYPTDFSRCAKHGLTYAVRLAEHFGAELQLFHAILLHGDDPYNPAYHFPDRDEIHRRVKEVADSEMGLLVEDQSTQLTIRQVQRRGIYAGPLILEYAQEHDIDLIIMGTHGHRGPAHLLLGSVADEVVRRARCPVLTLRELTEPRALAAPQSILVPVDFSDHSRRSVALARDLAQRYGARLQLLHVNEPINFPEFYDLAVPSPGEELERRSLEALHELMAAVGGPEVPFEVHAAVGRPAIEIAAFADQQASDLVVIATHGLTGIQRLVMGSTAEKVVRVCASPVLSVKWTEKDFAGEP